MNVARSQGVWTFAGEVPAEFNSTARFVRWINIRVTTGKNQADIIEMDELSEEEADDTKSIGVFNLGTKAVYQQASIKGQCHR